MKNDTALFIFDDRTQTRPEFDRLRQQHEPLFSKHQRIIIRSTDPVELYVALILARDLKRELFYCHSYFEDNDVIELADKNQIDLVLFDHWLDGREGAVRTGAIAEDVAGDSLYIFTSGTTGTAKIARHKWATIAHSSAFAGDRLDHRTWLMSYSPTSYAGLQVFFSAYNNGGTIYFPPLGYDRIAHSICKYQVEVISATPTYWRLLISSWPSDLKPVRLEQATLGGEVIDQSILDQIKTFFAPHRLTHIYASTEAGTAIVTSDGKAGFPVEFLDRTEGVLLRIVDDKLQVKTPAPMAEYLGGGTVRTDDDWLLTGDSVEIRANRVFLVGREDGMINVGGMKVSPDEVETALHTLDEIVDCRVFAKKSPLVGSIVVAEVVTRDNIPPDPRSIKKRLRLLMADYKVPQMLISVSEIEATPHGKKARK